MKDTIPDMIVHIGLSPKTSHISQGTTNITTSNKTIIITILFFIAHPIQLDILELSV